MTQLLQLEAYRRLIEETPAVQQQGRVTQVVGLTIEVEGLSPTLGQICHIYPEGGARISAEVVGFRGGRSILMPIGDPSGLSPGAPVATRGGQFMVPVGEGLLGRVVDGFVRPIDGKGPLLSRARRALIATPPHPLRRGRITEPMSTGVRAIDGLLTMGRGQRIGIFAGSGVGKSTLAGMVARHARADVNVIALIGERGREVLDFIHEELGEEGLRRSVVVVATSDQPALLRLKGAWAATVIAEYFRDQGLHVIFMMDSVTRFAMAQRELGLAAGEPPTSKGYPPSVFSLIPRLLERVGSGERGTISGFYTVLVEGDDVTEPITDTVRSIVDGHIHLSRELASENHYPAIDVMASVSRVMPQVTSERHRERAGQLRNLLATYSKARDLINIGAYVAGTNPAIDRAIRLMPEIRSYLQQRPSETCSLEEAVEGLCGLLEKDQGGEV